MINLHIKHKLKIYNYSYKRYMGHALNSINSNTPLTLRQLCCFCFHNVFDAFMTGKGIDTLHIDISKRLEQLLIKSPILHTRVIQVAFEVSCRKRYFTRLDLEYIFERDVNLCNILDSKDVTSYVEQSTIMNLFMGKFIMYKFPQIVCTINRTPIEPVEESMLSEATRCMLANNYSKCKNKFCDLSLDGVPYDFKHSKDICITLNHIYILPFTPVIISRFKTTLTHLRRLYEKKTNYITFYKKYLDKIEEIQQLLVHENKTAFPKILDRWNDFIIGTFSERPADFAIPIFLITSEQPLDVVMAEKNTTYNYTEYDVIDGEINYPSVKKGIDIIAHRKGLSEHTRKVLTGDLDTIFSRQDVFPIDGPD